MKPEVQAILFGGIGNQLFQFAYARKLALELGGFVSLDLRTLPSRGQQAGSSITDLDIEFLGAISSKSRVKSYIRKPFVLRSFRQQSTPFSDFLLRVDKNPLSSARRRIRVANYFQDKSAVEFYSGAKPISLREPKDLVQREYATVGSPGVVTVHHRLGDTLSLRESRGQLGEKFFQDSIELLRNELGDIRELYVYSDTPELSKELLERWLPDIRKTWAPDGLSAAHVLTALARAKHLILSNSTMSWWAAAAGEHENIITPSKWDRLGNDSLILDNWIKIYPDWA